MDKINFENLPSTNTSISAENLNKLQTNVETDINNVYTEFLQHETVEDFKNIVTFNETPANVSFLKKGKVVQITYQGENKAHAIGNNLFALPEGYRPIKETYFPFVKNAVGYGVIVIGRDGACSINQLSNTTASGRVYFTITYLI